MYRREQCPARATTTVIELYLGSSNRISIRVAAENLLTFSDLKRSLLRRKTKKRRRRRERNGRDD